MHYKVAVTFGTLSIKATIYRVRLFGIRGVDPGPESPASSSTATTPPAWSTASTDCPPPCRSCTTAAPGPAVPVVPFLEITGEYYLSL